MTALYLRTLLALTFLLTSNHLTAACGYYGALNNSFAVLHPRSIDVALALGDAAKAGVLKSSTGARKGGVFSHRHVVPRIQRFGSALASAAGESVSSFSMLLVDSGLWSRFLSLPEGVVFEIRTEGTHAGDTAVITGSAVLAALEAGTLSLDEAMERGLLVIVPGMSADSQKILSAFAVFAKADDSDQFAFVTSGGACWPK